MSATVGLPVGEALDIISSTDTIFPGYTYILIDMFKGERW